MSPVDPARAGPGGPGGGGGARGAARGERLFALRRTPGGGASRTARAAAAERAIASDLHALLDTRGDALGRVATPALVAAARGFARAALRRRFGNAGCVAAPALVRRTAAALASFSRRGVAEPEPGTDGVLAGHLAAFARDAFERLASHSATARVLLHPGANAPLPPSIAAMAAPLASLLPATHDDEDAELGAELGAEELGAEEDGAEDDAEGVETEEAFAHAAAGSASARDDRAARAAKVELVGALHALWSLHGEASAASGDDFDADEVLAASSQYDAERDPEELPPAHHAVWRAEQSALIPLLAAAHGATLSACDRRLGALLVEMDAAAGGGALRAMGYLLSLIHI